MYFLYVEFEDVGLDSLRDEFQVPERGRELNLPLTGNVELFRNQITCLVETLQHRQG